MPNHFSVECPSGYWNNEKSIILYLIDLQNNVCTMVTAEKRRGKDSSTLICRGIPIIYPPSFGKENRQVHS
jgi:hypothetical protein